MQISSGSFGVLSANLINMPTTSNQVYTIRFILNQSTTRQAYVNSLQINSGANYTILWQNGSPPTPSVPSSSTINDIEVVTLINIGSFWSAYGIYYKGFA